MKYVMVFNTTDHIVHTNDGVRFIAPHDWGYVEEGNVLASNDANSGSPLLIQDYTTINEMSADRVQEVAKEITALNSVEDAKASPDTSGEDVPTDTVNPDSETASKKSKKG